MDIGNLDPITQVTPTTKLVTSEAKLLAYEYLLSQIRTDTINDNLVNPANNKSLSQQGLLTLLASYVNTQQLTQAIIAATVPATSTTKGLVALPVNKIITISNNTTDATNDIDVGAGWFNFDDGTGQAYYAGGTGQLDIVFGTNNGMLDTGTIANTTYHIFLIHNPTTLVSKILASTSVSSPTLPTDYTKKARIGSIIRASGAILAFEQFDKKFILGGAKIVDRAISAPPTTASNQTVTTPAGISTRAISLIECEPTSAYGSTFLIIEPTTHTSTTPTSTNHTLFVWHFAGGPNSLSTQIETKTNTTSQIIINANISTSHNLRIIAVGWIDYQLNY